MQSVKKGMTTLRRIHRDTHSRGAKEPEVQQLGVLDQGWAIPVCETQLSLLEGSQQRRRENSYRVHRTIGKGRRTTSRLIPSYAWGTMLTGGVGGGGFCPLRLAASNTILIFNSGQTAVWPMPGLIDQLIWYVLHVLFIYISEYPGQYNIHI